MLKNLFSFLLGCLVGVLIMGFTVFILQAQARMDLMPVIMLACVLILVLIGVICWWWMSRKNQRRAR